MHAGLDVTLIDRNAPGAETSKGNAGALAYSEVLPLSRPSTVRNIPHWLLDPLGPLSIRVRDSIDLIPWFVRFVSLSTMKKVRARMRALRDLNFLARERTEWLLNATRLGSECSEIGVIYPYETENALISSLPDWEIRTEVGVEFTVLKKDELREIEPALSTDFHAGILINTKYWSLIRDPFGFSEKLANYAHEHGVNVINEEVIGIRPTSHNVLIATGNKGELCCDTAVIATGPWSKRMTAILGDRVLLSPERGYMTTLPNPQIDLSHMLVFKKYGFVATPLAMGIRVGGGGEIASLDAPPNYKRAGNFVRRAKAFLPGLNDANGKVWMGSRPSTPDSLPVISRSPRNARIFYAFGHGHLGLTQAAGTGLLIAQLVQGNKTSIGTEPFSITRFN